MKNKVVETTRDDKPFKMIINKPGRVAQTKAQLEYNRCLKDAMESGAFLRKQLYKKLEEEGVWTDDHEKKQQDVLDRIRAAEDKIRSGGLKLSELKQMGIELKNLRAEHRMLIAERSSEDLKTAESQAENARFYSFITTCVMNENNQPVFSSLDQYEEYSEEPWAVEAVEELANMMYGLDASYENNLVENRFLKRYGIIDEKNYFVNEDGSRVDAEGRLINEKGEYINEKGERINKDGRRINDFGDYLDAEPMLDDKGNPIILDKEEDDSDEEEKPKPKKRRSTKKATE